MTRALYALALVAGLAAGVAGVAGIGGHGWRIQASAVVPLGGLELAMDPLAGLFLALAGFTTAAVSLYAIGYAGDHGRGPTYLVFVGAMFTVPLAANVMTFLIAWEVMSLTSWALVLDGRDDPATRRAGWTYAVMTHAGFACLLVAMLLLSAHVQSPRFADWQAAAPGFGSGLRNGAWVLLALGFAGKAGVIPLHVWLPLAHPAAPSHVSALMSGVMIKLGIYGLLRAGFEWLGPGPAWWGGALLVLGAVSAVVGILYALVDADLKRLLAFSSIENVGVILIGVGGALLFMHGGVPALAALALLAALYHAVNHAVFKALLFLGAGAVVQRTGTRSMDACGGLIKRMPWTAACFLVGAASISALPPLNGFVSEWLALQALFQSVRLAQPGMNVVFAVGIAALALTAGLAAACFVKTFGITFLATPRSPGAARAHEAGWAMRGAMVALAVACGALGLGAPVITPALARVSASALGVTAAPIYAEGTVIGVADGFASVSPPLITTALVAGLVVPWMLLALTRGAHRARPGETWACGRILQTARMQYTATAFADPFKRVFRFFYRPVPHFEMDVHPESRFFVQRIMYANPVPALFEEWLYRPLLRGFRAGIQRLEALQSGSASAYLAYILGALLALLALR